MMWAAVEGLGMVSLFKVRRTTPDVVLQSRYQVKRYTFTFFQLFTITTSALMYWIFLTSKPLTPLEPFFQRNIPPMLQMFFMSLPPIAHTVENQLFMVPLLRKHRVPPKVRVKWVVACLASGGPTIKAFKNLVREEKYKLDNETKDL